MAKSHAKSDATCTHEKIVEIDTTKHGVTFGECSDCHVTMVMGEKKQTWHWLIDDGTRVMKSGMKRIEGAS